MSFHRKPAYQKWIMAVLIWPLEAAGLFILISILGILPRRSASFLMGWLLRKLGPLTRWHERSRTHLLYALPHLDQTQTRQILNDMWDNLGRNIGEYFHLKSLLKSPDLTISGLEHIDKTKGGFLITGHFGNWEITPLILSLTRISGGLIYRPMNNPIANRVFKARASGDNIAAFEKGREGAAGMLRVVKDGGLMLLLSDQTLREGTAAPFFGAEVPTATSHIKLATKTGLPIYFVRSRRISGARHLLKISPPIYIEKDADASKQAQYAAEMNAQFESWIREEPSQWLWPHRRWGKSLPKKGSK